MKNKWRWIPANCTLVLMSVVLYSSMLTACTKSDIPFSDSKPVPVSIHGVNYTAEPFSFVVIDPQDPKNYGGGELINSYSAGGTACCYALPTKWRSGLKVEVAETYWLPMKKDKSVPEIKRKHVVEVPPYPDGEAGELWVLRTAEDITVVSSNVQPDHPDWPGKIKGWPVPSIEYRRELYDRSIAEAQSTVNVFARSLEKLNKEPHKRALEDWNLSLALEPEVLRPYKGPDDPAYIEALKKEYFHELEKARDHLGEIKARRP